MTKFIKISLFLLTTTFLLLGFAVAVNPPNGTWYQQFFPNLNGRAIIDIEFTDSLTGYAITNTDTPLVLKTINGGDSWTVIFNDNESFTSMAFINSYTGFITRGFVNGTDLIFKTTNGGTNWTTLIMPQEGIANDMSVLSEDTLWVADPAPLIGGIYRTTDKGISWERIYGGTANNAERIYMYNGRIGFMYTSTAGPLWKTTNSGYNWFSVPGGVYLDIYFIDSLTGWKANGDMKKTTDGGLSWVTQILPYGGLIESSGITSFSNINKDTIWANGGYIRYPNNQLRRYLHRTTNGGVTWYFQIPDTSFKGDWSFVNFHNKLIGWATSSFVGFYTDQIHTTNGGDTTFLLGLQQLSSESPREFVLFQNYPNPFNPKTNIKYTVMPNVKGQMSNVRLVVYDISGREVVTLVDQKQNAGTYEVDFSGHRYSSGVYFYRLSISNRKEVFTDTKKMLMIK